MDYKISIILPIFNVDKYLRNALDSIINQTFGITNLEIIMVDDCSTDNSGVIVDEYSEKYENFIAIHLDENSGGAGIPKNTGIKSATGDYLMFLDPDDEFMPDICETLYGKLIETNSDFVSGNAITIYNNHEEIDLKYSEEFIEVIPNKNLELFRPFRIFGSLFNKKFIIDNDIRFLDSATNEDTYFAYACFLNANKIYFLNDYIGLKYFVRDVEEHVSLSHDYSKDMILGTIDAFEQISSLINDSNPTKDFVYDPFISNIYARFANKWKMSSKDKKEIFDKVREYIYNSNYVIKLPVHHKILHLFIKFKLDSTLCIVQRVYSSFLESEFSKKFLIPRINREL